MVGISGDWEESRRPLIGRLAGGFWLAGLVPGFVDPGGVHNKLFANLSTPQIVDWAAHNQTGISVSAFVGTFQWALWAIAAVLTISLLRGRGIVAAIGYISVASGIATTWVTAVIMFALLVDAPPADAACVAWWAGRLIPRGGWACRPAPANGHALRDYRTRQPSLFNTLDPGHRHHPHRQAGMGTALATHSSARRLNLRSAMYGHLRL